MIRKAARSWKWLVALLVVFGTTWYFSHPTPRWMNFESLSASYELGTTEIAVIGHYTVRRTCKEPVVWRMEALATDGQIAVYGPRPPNPPVTQGEHEYNNAIALLEEIQPDGWIVHAFVTCGPEQPATIVSPPARVTTVVAQRGPR